MSFLKWIYPQNSLKRKIINIKDDIEKEVKFLYKEKIWIEFYGAFNINPKYLVYWICVETDETKFNIKSDTNLIKRLRNLLKIHKYPSSSIESVIIDVESQETVNRESSGNWYTHFK